MNRTLKRLGLLLGVLAVIATIVVAILPKPVMVEAAEAKVIDLRVTVDEDGRTRVKDRYVISAPLMANVARIELSPGDEVKEGDLLLRMVPLAAPLMDARSRAQAEAAVAAARAGQRQAKATIERAEMALEFADKEAGRQRSLLSSGGSTTQAVERAELNLRSRREDVVSSKFAARIAAHELKMAEARLGRTGAEASDQLQVAAPVNGRVLRVMHESEGVVQPGTPLVELGNPAALEVVVDVLTADAVHIEQGAAVLLERWGGQKALKGSVRLVEPSAFTRVSALGVEEQRVNVVIELLDPRDEWLALGDGYRVEAQIIVWESKDALSVPASAVFRHDDGWAVFSIRDGSAVLQPVDVGRRNGLAVQVLKGLTEGDRVVVHPSDRVRDGVAVTVRGNV